MGRRVLLRAECGKGDDRNRHARFGGTMIRHVFDVESWALSDTGRVRELNEDRYLMEPDIGIYVVADGMGGHDAGEVASTSIVEHLKSVGIPSSAPDLRARVEDRLTLANSEIREISMMRNGVTIGSTVAALLAFEHQFACVWAGDSRVYCLRDGELAQVSRDHTEVQDLVDRGLLTREEAITWPRRNVITRAIGVMNQPPLEITQGEILPGDTFLVCSDGLTAHVTDDQIRDILASQMPPREECENLIQLALEGGGTDNVTVVIARFQSAQAGGLADPWKN
jgi:protein phosphatase